MRTATFLLVFFIFSFTAAQAQSIKNTIAGCNWQEGKTSIIWTFTDSGTFSACRFWMTSKKNKMGFTLKKGVFHVDDSAKTMTVIFDSTYNVYSKDSLLMSKDTGLQEVWDLIAVSDNKLIIKRPAVWESEKRNIKSSGEIITVTLEGERKRKKNQTLKT